MSKLPKIPTNFSDGFNGYPKVQSPLSSTTLGSQTNNTPDDFPIINHFNPYVQQTKLSPFAFEAKLNEFESKMIVLEQTNINLMHRLQENETDFERKLKLMQTKADEERESRYKSDKAITLMSENNNFSSSDLKIRLNTIQNIIEKDERWKVEQRNKDMEMYKNLITKLTEKVASTVKLEVDARCKADNDNKLLTQGVNSRFENELDQMRRDLDDFMTSIKQELNKTSKECSERTHTVSKYVDQQLESAVFANNDANDNLKSFVYKLTDQVKTNLVSQSSQNEQMDSKIKRLEEFIPQMKDSFYAFISTVEERIIKKVRDIKHFSEINIRKIHEGLSGQISELSKNTDDNINILSNQLIETRNTINFTLDDYNRENKERFNAVCEDLTSITNRVYLYEDILKQHEQRYDEITLKIDEEVNLIRINYDVQTVNERIIRAIENEDIKDNIRECIQALGGINSNFNDNMKEINKSSETNFSALVERMNTLQDMINKLSEKNYFMFEDVQKNLDKIEVRQMMNECLFRTEDEYIIDQLQKNKMFEIDTKKELSSLSSTFNSSGSNLKGMIGQMSDLIKEKEAKEGVNRTIEQILNEVDTRAKDLYSDNESNQNREIILNAFNSLDNKFQDHINNNDSEFKIVKDLIDNVGKSSKKHSETEVVVAMQQVVNNAEFNNIYSHLNKLRTKPSSTKVVDIIKESGQIEPKDLYDENEIDSDMMDTKINKALEKIKDDNINMWANAVELSQKFNQLNEIKKIISEVPPLIIPMNESMKRILDLNYTNDYNARAVVPLLFQKRNEDESNRYQESEPPQQNVDIMNNVQYDDNFPNQNQE